MQVLKLLSDADLLQLVKQEDASAFRTLYDRYWRELYLKACKRVDEDTAKDMIQEVMTTLWRRRDDITADKDGEIARYLYTALKYRIITYYAFTASEIRKITFFDCLMEIPSDNNLEIKELKELIESEVCKLPVRMQQIFRMSREDDVSISEIAGQLNLSEQTVKNQLTTALKRLREKLNTKNISDYALMLMFVFYQMLSPGHPQKLTSRSEQYAGGSFNSPL